MKRSKNKIPKLTRKLTEVFNRFIRLRDRNQPCISCGKFSVLQAGHYLPTSVYPHPSLRFNEFNVNGQCVSCNKWRHGAQHEYAIGLKKKYGAGIIDKLDILRSVNKNPWTPFEYEVCIKLYEEKARKLNDQAGTHEAPEVI